MNKLQPTTHNTQHVYQQHTQETINTVAQETINAVAPESNAIKAIGKEDNSYSLPEMNSSTVKVAKIIGSAVSTIGGLVGGAVAVGTHFFAGKAFTFLGLSVVVPTLPLWASALIVAGSTAALSVASYLVYSLLTSNPNEVTLEN